MRGTEASASPHLRQVRRARMTTGARRGAGRPRAQGPRHRGLVQPGGGVGATMVRQGRTYAASDVRFWLLANIFAVYPIATPLGCSTRPFVGFHTLFGRKGKKR